MSIRKRKSLFQVLSFWMANLVILSQSQWVWAQDLSSALTLSRDLTQSRMNFGNEYISGDYPGAVLMKINLWGAVGKTGIHFVPTRTDLITLLSYAGGPAPAANLSEVYIKRWSRGSQQIIPVNTDQLIKGTGTESPVLEANDIVVVPTKAPLISSDAAALIGIVSSIASIVAIGFVLVRK